MKSSAPEREEVDQRNAVEEELTALSRLVLRPLDDRNAGQPRQDVVQRTEDAVRRVLGAVRCRLYTEPIPAPRGGLVEKALRERMPLATPEGDGDAVLVVPMLYGDRPIGALEVSRSRGSWTSEEIRLVQLFADQATAGIEIAHLASESRQRRRTAEALALMAQATSRSFDVSTLSREIVGTLLVLLGCARATLFELTGSGFRLVAVARADRFEDAADVAGPELGPVEALAMRDRRLVVTADFLTDPGMSPTTPDRALEEVPIRAMLAVPLFHDETPIGILSVGDRVRRVFGPEEVEVFRAAAGHAAVALQHARLHAQVAEAARVRERVHIANELHDTLSQLAFSVGLKLDWCLHRIAETAPLRPKLEDIRRDTGLMMAQIRQLIGHLSPEGLEETTFAKRLERLVKDFGELTGVAAELDLRGDLSSLPSAARDVLQKTLQEALVNIAKHARAQRAAVCIEVGGDQASIQVADDGVGLRAGAVEATRARPGHLGLRQMRERIEAVGGRLEISGRPGAGVSIRGVFPLPLGGK